MKPAEIFERPDWALFRSLATLCQKAGVDQHQLPALLVKELVDNALDEAGSCRFGLLEGENGFWVEDEGRGLPGDDEAIAHLFSVRRGYQSSKLWRMPSRGTLGNGSRIVAGAVLATGGRLLVRTRGRELELRPKDDGYTSFRELRNDATEPGTRLEVILGSALPLTDSALDLGRRARVMAIGNIYQGKTSPHWYGADSFFDLCQTAKDMSLESFLQKFDGCSNRAVKEIWAVIDKNKTCASLEREEAEEFLRLVRSYARPFKASRLGSIGARSFLGDEYARCEGSLSLVPGRGTIPADVPFIAEAWVTSLEYGSFINPFVNRTPVIGQLHVFQSENNVIVQGCGLNSEQKVAGLSRLGFSIILNIQTPFMPLTNDGKSPDLSHFAHHLNDLLGRILKKLVRGERKLRSQTPKVYISDVVLENLGRAVKKGSGNGQFRYSQRQLFYVMRPIVQNIAGEVLSYSYFTRLLTRYENEYGPIPGMYRDPRGYLYHPHMKRRIPLGTQFIEGYERPAWTFNKIMYIEKKGLLETLVSVDWPERNDCAILAAEGQATRADKDLLDLLGKSPEPLTFFCVHDADAYGTLIYDRLQHESKARVARQVTIVNLGLDPWEALEMGLEWEPADNERIAPVADYVSDPYWREWLQTRRVELNAMTPGQLLDWLDEKMEAYEGKLIPPKEVIEKSLEDCSEQFLKQFIQRHLEERANLPGQCAEALDDLLPKLRECCTKQSKASMNRLQALISSEPNKLWTEHIKTLALELADTIHSSEFAPSPRPKSLDWIRPNEPL